MKLPEGDAAGMGRGVQRVAVLPFAASLAFLASLQFPAGAAEASLRPLWWHAPFLSGGGYSSEALSYVLALAQEPALRSRLWIAQHGDGVSGEAVADLSADEQRILRPLFKNSMPASVKNGAIVICHRLSEEHVRRCNRMDEVWVPTTFHVGTFSSSGVEPHRLKVVPQAVDTDLFDPRGHDPLPLPIGKLVFGSGASASTPFVFVSVFKWEKRKAWDVLLTAYLTEFQAEEEVMLVLVTKPYHSDSDFVQKMRTWARQSLRKDRAAISYPRVYVESGHLPQRKLLSLYKASDAFVLPSRGEGWGRPHVEAMAMELPVLATNWSGPTAFLSEDVGYPIPIDSLEEVTEGPFRGHLWSSPSVPDLRRLMRHVATHKAEAAAKGRLARHHMMDNFSRQKVSKEVLANLERINKLLDEAGGHREL